MKTSLKSERVRHVFYRVGEICLHVLAICALALASLVSSRAIAVEPKNVYRPDKVDQSVERALRFLMSQQDATGYICDTKRNQVAMTSLSVLAFAAVGHQPSEPTPEGRAMKRAIQFVLQPANQQSDGYFGAKDGSRMYGHGITTLMLGEVAGHGVDAAMDRQLYDRLKKGVELILRSQQIRKETAAQGGWRYQPDARDSDLSVTVWQIMALRSARNAGLKVPSESIDAALTYVRRCYGSDLDSRGNPYDLNAGFAYQPERDERLSTSTSAMGLLCLQLAGDYESPFVKGSTQWLSKNPPSWGDHWMFYGSYYYAQGMYQVGGRLWEKADKQMHGLLLPEQRANGSWEPTSPKERQAGHVYATSLAVLALSVKYHYLPIYQR